VDREEDEGDNKKDDECTEPSDDRDENGLLARSSGPPALRPASRSGIGKSRPGVIGTNPRASSVTHATVIPRAQGCLKIGGPFLWAEVAIDHILAPVVATVSA
jgi:hypothetical protein